MAQGKHFTDRLVTDANGVTHSLGPLTQQEYADSLDRYSNPPTFSKPTGISSYINWDSEPRTGIGDKINWTPTNRGVTVDQEEPSGGVLIANNSDRDAVVKIGGRIADWMVPDFMQNRGPAIQQRQFSPWADGGDSPNIYQNMWGGAPVQSDGIAALAAPRVKKGTTNDSYVPTTPTTPPPVAPLGNWAWREYPAGGYFPAQAFGYYV
jgi:hypothetical protein